MEMDPAYTGFFRAQYPQVKRTVYLIVRDKDLAEDVAQESFIRLLDHWKKVSKYDQPESWVRRVAIRLAVKAARRERLRSISEAFAQRTEAPSPMDTDLLSVVAKLPPAQRAAVVLFYYEDRPVSEIAQLLDCSLSTAKVHLHKARRKLASLLREEAINVG